MIYFFSFYKISIVIFRKCVVMMRFSIVIAISNWLKFFDKFKAEFFFFYIYFVSSIRSV